MFSHILCPWSTQGASVACEGSGTNNDTRYMTPSSLLPLYQLTKTSQVYGSEGSEAREMVPKYNHRALTRGRKWMNHFTYRRGRNVTTETEVGGVVTH